MKNIKFTLILASALLAAGCFSPMICQAAEKDSSDSKVVTFADAVDINGDPVSEDLLKDAKVVILNLWEPWCSPCVGEMPDLEKLYEDYKDDGLLVIGVYSYTDMDDDAKDIVEENGITYPILKCTDELRDLATAYVPATYILDGDGTILTEEAEIGAHDYDYWEETIQEYLK